MKRYRCRCGQPIFFDNSQCINCGAPLGFDPGTLTLYALTETAEGWRSDEGYLFRHCGNRIDYGNCNWLIEVNDDQAYCLSCRLNRTIPNLSSQRNIDYWNHLEVAKRRLLYTLLHLGLPVRSKQPDWPHGLAFDFIEDQRSNPDVEHEFVTTGHESGVITINVAEADDVIRAMARKRMDERYRTLLGHFRHESGHYYLSLLASTDAQRDAFRLTFGDDTDYAEALTTYYRDGPPADWPSRYISAYAAAHPEEDWAETWAHYLHMYATMETAAEYGVISDDHSADDFAHQLEQWRALTVIMNELNRSMGARDAYPFVVTETVAGKLKYVHDLIIDYQSRGDGGQASL